MRRLAFYLLLFASLVVSCARPAESPPVAAFYLFRLNPPALLELSQDLATIAREIPLSFAPDCGLFSLYPAPRGTKIALELSCPFGQTVLLLDVETGAASPAFAEADSHFLAWSADGGSLYLKVDSLGNARLLRAHVKGGNLDFVPITALTYDLAPAPNGRQFTFTFSRGLGFGSELWLAEKNGNAVRQLLTDVSILALARWSPDGRQIAFIKIPDSQTPFTVGELWAMEADGSNPRFLAKADGGHGYAPAWSPGGARVAFVVRENPDDPRADQGAGELLSNIYTAEIESGRIGRVTALKGALVEAPFWSPDGHFLAFTTVLNDKMSVWMADLSSGEVKPLLGEPACCPAWIQK